MKALVFHGPGQRSWDSVPDPEIVEATYVIVRIHLTTICGTDLHILKGDAPEVEPGMILGHEAVATVVEKGLAVTTLRSGRPGSRLLHDGPRALPLLQGRPLRPLDRGGGWILGHLINGLQADFARIPFADIPCTSSPKEIADEQALFLADILPTSYEVGVLNGPR